MPPRSSSYRRHRRSCRFPGDRRTRRDARLAVVGALANFTNQTTLRLRTECRREQRHCHRRLARDGDHLDFPDGVPDHADRHGDNGRDRRLRIGQVQRRQRPSLYQRCRAERGTQGSGRPRRARLWCRDALHRRHADRRFWSGRSRHRPCRRERHHRACHGGYRRGRTAHDPQRHGDHAWRGSDAALRLHRPADRADRANRHLGDAVQHRLWHGAESDAAQRERFGGRRDDWRQLCLHAAGRHVPACRRRPDAVSAVPAVRHDSLRRSVLVGHDRRDAGDADGHARRQVEGRRPAESAAHVYAARVRARRYAGSRDGSARRSRRRPPSRVQRARIRSRRSSET